MSQPFQEWLREKGNETLGITEKERQALEHKREIFCGLATEEIKKHAGEVPDPMALFEQMPEEQKRSFAKKVIDDGLIMLGLRKKKVAQEAEEEMLEISNHNRVPN